MHLFHHRCYTPKCPETKERKDKGQNENNTWLFFTQYPTSPQKDRSPTRWRRRPTLEPATTVAIESSCLPKCQHPKSKDVNEGKFYFCKPSHEDRDRGGGAASSYDRVARKQVGGREQIEGKKSEVTEDEWALKKWRDDIWWFKTLRWNKMRWWWDDTIYNIYIYIYIYIHYDYDTIITLLPNLLMYILLHCTSEPKR